MGWNTKKADRKRAKQNRKDVRWGQDFDSPMEMEQNINRQALEQQGALAGDQYQGAYGEMGASMGMYDDMIAGEGPSVAQAQLEQQSGQNIASQMAMAGQARGGNMAAASQAAAAQGAGMQMQTNQQMAQLRAEEQQAAMAARANLAGQMAGMSSDRQMSYEGMNQGAMQFQQGQQQALQQDQNAHREERKKANREYGWKISDGILGAAGTVVGAIVSDKRLKSGVKKVTSPIAMLLLGSKKGDECETCECGEDRCPVCGEVHDSDDDLAKVLATREALSSMEPVEYEYKGKARKMGAPSGKIVGILAQDLEDSELGSEIVEEKDGAKKLNAVKSISLLLAGAADHEKRLAELEEKAA